jgi:hypothetical protein
MKNSDMPAMPVVPAFEDCMALDSGLTKREHFAGLAMAALLSATDESGKWSGINAGAGEQAVIEADALLAALEEKGQ